MLYLIRIIRILQFLKFVVVDANKSKFVNRKGEILDGLDKSKDLLQFGAAVAISTDIQNFLVYFRIFDYETDILRINVLFAICFPDDKLRNVN